MISERIKDFIYIREEDAQNCCYSLILHAAVPYIYSNLYFSLVSPLSLLCFQASR